MYGRAARTLTHTFEVNVLAGGSESVFHPIAMTKSLGHSCSVRVRVRCGFGIFFVNLRRFLRR